jgi:hypothetical protein
MANVPTMFPVWLVGANGESVVVGDALSYAAALANGAAAFATTTPSATVMPDGGGPIAFSVVELPFNPVQTLPTVDSSAPPGDF